MNFTKTISSDAALAAAQALDKVIRWRKNLIDTMTENSSSVFQDDILEMFKKMQEEDKAAFKEVSGYDFDE